MSYMVYPVKCNKCGKLVSTTYGIVGTTQVAIPVRSCECGGTFERILPQIKSTRRKIMRELNVGTKRHTKVIVLDEPGPGNANHNYEIIPTSETGFVLGKIVFQNGPIKENRVNGVHNEDLIAIVIDRLKGFQSGKYACAENREAIKHLKGALTILGKRTTDREARGVEGTSEV